MRLSLDHRDLFEPSPYELWKTYVIGTKLETFIDDTAFAIYLHECGSIELYYKGLRKTKYLQCKIKDIDSLKANLSRLCRIADSSVFDRIYFRALLWLRWTQIKTYNTP